MANLLIISRFIDFFPKPSKTKTAAQPNFASPMLPSTILLFRAEFSYTVLRNFGR